MSKLNVIRAWKNEEFRRGLTAAERAQLPENPAGAIELTSDELMSIDGSNGNIDSGIPCILRDEGYTKDGPFCPSKSGIECSRGGSGLTSTTLR